jgi:hypothetical protein
VEPGRGVYLGLPAFTQYGRYVVASTLWDPDDDQPTTPPDPDALGVHVWDARTGRVVEHFDVGRCGGFSRAISVDAVLVETFPEGTPEPSDCFGADGASALTLVSLADGQRRELAADTWLDGVLSADGRFAALRRMRRGSTSGRSWSSSTRATSSRAWRWRPPGTRTPTCAA